MPPIVTCLLYIAVLGMAAFPFGRLLARCPLRTDGFPFRCAAWERGGKNYEKLHIRAWQNRVPDVSRWFPSLVPVKRLESPTPEGMGRMVRETCVAELTHVLLILLGLYCLRLWPGVGGVIFYCVYTLAGNVPFILIQRYNRPRLVRLQKAMEKKERKREGIDPNVA